MVIVKIQKQYLFAAFWTLQRVIAEGEEKKCPSLIEIQEDPVLGSMRDFMKGCIYLAMAGIKAIITGYLEMLFRNVLDQEFYEIQYRNCFFNIRIIFMPIVMESDILPVIGVNA